MMTNCAEIAERIHRVCNGEQNYEPLLGKLEYPKQLVHAIVAGLLEYKDNVNMHEAIATVYAVEVFTKEADDAKIMQSLRRCHDNLGHPSNERLITMLKSANANSKTIKLAKGLTCPACRMKDGSRAHPVARVKHAWEFNQQIMCDTMEVDVIGRKLKLLNVVDAATAFQMVAPLWSGCTALNVRTCYRKYWKRWAGCPVRLLSDNGHEFDGEFRQGLEIDGTFY